MSEATQRVRDFLTKSPSVVYPDDVLGLFERVERENAKLRELVEDMLDYIEIREAFGRPPTSEMCEKFAQRADELGIEWREI